MAIRYAGVDLSTFGAGAQLSDGARGAPSARGSNLLVPYQQGQRWTPKYYDERHIVIQGVFSATSRAAMDAAIDNFKGVFPLNAGEQKLERQQADGSYRYVMAEARNIIIQEDYQDADKFAKWSLELVASDPFWYGSALQSPANLGAGAWTFDSGVLFDDGAHWFGPALGALFAITLTSQVTAIVSPNSGTATSRKPVFTLAGAMQNPKITNTRNGYSVQVLVSNFPVGTVLTIDCGAQALTLGGGVYPNDAVALGAGQADWMHLDPGDNNLLIDVGLPAPSVAYAASYSPVYL